MYARSHERYEEMGLSVGTMVLAVGLGGIGMKRGEVLVQLLGGHLVGVTFSSGRSLQRTGAPFVIQAIVSRSERDTVGCLVLLSA